MLPSFIIDQIRQREEEERKDQSPRIELPLPPPAREGAPAPDLEEEAERGVVIIDLMAR